MKSSTLAPAIFICGILSPIFFVTVFLIDGATRPDYDPYYHWISHLSLGERGWIGIVNLIVMGINITFLGILARKCLRGKRTSWGPRLILLLGIGLLLCGVFVIDPMLDYPPETQAHLSLIGIFHFISSFVMFEALIATCFVMAFRFSKWFSVYSIISGSLILLSIIICVGFVVLDFTETFVGGPGGLFERISMVIGCLWIVVFSSLLIRRIRD
ncbi:DUF998 domain-containing protein [Bacillus marasmi]|uniref:DUF998 domain-containing protein n=1 Tax=Bacillus marasmi TaxID=1926279 RepID=UPI0011C9B25B|nr:DUF998 domain-containing protein [Bacillus marasmi]